MKRFSASPADFLRRRPGLTALAAVAAGVAILVALGRSSVSSPAPPPPAPARAVEVPPPKVASPEFEASRQARAALERRAAEARARQDVEDVYLTKVEPAFREAMARRDPRRAARAVAEFLYAPWSREKRPFTQAGGVDYERLRRALEVWDPEEVARICDAAIPEATDAGRLQAAHAAILDLRSAAWVAVFLRDAEESYRRILASGERVELPGLGAGRFDRRDDRTVFVPDGGSPVEASDRPLSEDDCAVLALRARPEDPLARARAGMFFYYSAGGRKGEAFRHLLRAREGGVRGLDPYLKGATESAREDLARRLEVKFGAAEDCFRKGQRETARRLIGELLEHPDHPYVRERRPALERMLTEIAEGTPEERKLSAKYRGRVEVLQEGNRLRVFYDFAGAEQQDAFEIVQAEGARRFPGRWKIEEGALESGPGASVAIWKFSVKGDVTVEYDLEPVENAQNIALDLYYRRGEASHYGAIVGFDWVGRSEGDADDTAEDRQGMPRTVLLKFPVSVEKARWREAAGWVGWLSRRVGPGAGAWRPERGSRVRLKVVREGTRLALYADGALLCEGEDGEYHEGGLLFYSDSRCRIDNLSIVFTPG
ncbi:MAG: hypothetical protein ACK44W_12695 [Planctomycetota bacterium]